MLFDEPESGPAAEQSLGPGALQTRSTAVATLEAPHLQEAPLKLGRAPAHTVWRLGRELIFRIAALCVVVVLMAWLGPPRTILVLLGLALLPLVLSLVICLLPLVVVLLMGLLGFLAVLTVGLFAFSTLKIRNLLSRKG